MFSSLGTIVRVKTGGNKRCILVPWITQRRIMFVPDTLWTPSANLLSKNKTLFKNGRLIRGCRLPERAWSNESIILLVWTSVDVVLSVVWCETYALDRLELVSERSEQPKFDKRMVPNERGRRPKRHRKRNGRFWGRRGPRAKPLTGQS